MLLHNCNQIIRFFTEPYAVLLLGSVLFLAVDLCRNHRRSVIGWMLLGYFGFNLLWLLCFGRMLSARYAMTLFVPGVLCMGYLWEGFRGRRARIRNGRFPAVWLAALLFAGLAVFCGAKMFLVKTKQWDRIGAALAACSVPGEECIVYCNKEPERLQYYSGMTAKLITMPPEASAEELIRRLERRCFYYDHWLKAQYAVLILPRPQAEKVIKALSAENAPFCLLCIEPYRRGDSAQALLMRRKHPVQKIDANWQSVPLRNGDFSDCLPEPWLRKRREGFIGQGIPFFKDENVKLPSHWFFYTEDPEARAFLRETDPKLCLVARDYFRLAYFEPIRYTGREILCVSVSGKAEKFSVQLYSRRLKAFYLVAEIALTPRMQDYIVPLFHDRIPQDESVDLQFCVFGGEACLNKVRLLRRPAPEQSAGQSD